MKISQNSYHPIANFIYFFIVLFFAMVITNPICILLSLFSSFCYALCLKVQKSSLFYLLPTMLLTAIINPLFNHEGNTILYYFKSQNPLTLESIIYGIVSALIIANLILWFICLSKVLTSDKIIYLFGKISPSLSLILSMTLRFIPKFKNQFILVQQFYTNGSKITKTVNILSIMITWSLENAIETADSMKSRGYGLPNRSFFSIYKFDTRDKFFIIWILFCSFFIIIGFKEFSFYYFPVIKSIEIEHISLYFAYFLLTLTPTLLEIKEAWKT